MGFQTVDSFLNARIKGDEAIDANDRIAQAITWEKHDILPKRHLLMEI